MRCNGAGSAGLPFSVRFLAQIVRHAPANRLVVDAHDLAGHVVGKWAGQPEQEAGYFFGRVESAYLVKPFKAARF
jgi:hypothetical protein